MARHRDRARRWTQPAIRRRATGRPDPIEDFLFTYYRLSFAKLEQWHPGAGHHLVDHPSRPGYLRASPYRTSRAGFVADPQRLSEKGRARLFWIRELLDQTRNRPANFSCHGLHEWAMVYRGSDVRHENSTPFRLPQAEIDHLVESRPLICSHFDALRFFQADAVPLNRLKPTLETRPDFEQPGCVHANMDLYKWAAKSRHWVGSDLLMDCFELAIELRRLDMRASPYDLRPYGHEPVPIETSDGRREYEQIQKSLAARARPLRDQMIHRLDTALAAIAPDSCHRGAGRLRPET